MLSWPMKRSRAFDLLHAIGHPFPQDFRHYDCLLVFSPSILQQSGQHSRNSHRSSIDSVWPLQALFSSTLIFRAKSATLVIRTDGSASDFAITIVNACA